MAEKFKFTMRRIREIKPPESGRDYCRDLGCKGLEVCVSATGSKTYYFYRRIAGKPRRIRIGTADSMTVEDARHAVATIMGEVATGRDPAEERRLKKNEKTLAELFDDWLEVHAKPRKKTWADDERQFKRYLEPFHAVRLSTITASRIARWHVQLGKDSGPVQANRVKTLLGTVLAFGVKLGLLTTNPAKSVSSFPERSRERFLLPSEMTAFFDALAQIGEPWEDFFRLCLFTGARRANVQSMEWGEIDFDRMVWTVPASKSKNKRTLLVPLSPPAIIILKNRLSFATSSPFVFASHGKHGYLAAPKWPWEKVRILSGLTDLRIHDLRRSLGSWQATAGASLSIIGASLGHADLKSTQVYARLQMDPVRLSVESAVESMRKAGGLVTDDAEKDQGDGDD